ncbi:MAG: glycyl-radical enzyme activating protein [Candidatus Jordarchaeum sp.]|uniref:glycyl-radical enzyme activating protein n=1 Tax=Candidatus Jordarchaeum sp. TaxID=2823881 RepID=UPI00404A6B14
MAKKPLIVDIKRNSLDDGPGIRTLIFFKGCPLSCVWCQNPETKSPAQEIAFYREDCVECGKCLEACQRKAIDFSYKYRIDRSICNLCGECIKVCPNEALKFVGKEYEIRDLVDILLKDRIFYQNSGGGVTLSGGEPLYHMEYVSQLLKELKKENIHVCIETCGYYNREKFNELILPYVDLIYFDLKIIDPESHLKYCKARNEKIFSNFESLIKNQKLEVLPRIPLIPNITTTEENLTGLAHYLKSFNIKKIGLLTYNPLWLSKPEKIGVESEYHRSDWLNNEEKEIIKAIFSDFEFENF